VVREYGLLFDVIVEECRAAGAGPFDPDEYAHLVGCLSRGASEAVREFAGLRALELRRQAWEHFAFLAHEIRNPLQTARTAAHLLRSEAPSRAVEVLERSLTQLSENRRPRPGRRPPAWNPRRLRTASRDDRSGRAAQALHRRRDAGRGGAPDSPWCSTGPRCGSTGMRASCAPRLGILVRNAVKFTRSGGKVTVRARPGAVEIEDQCGGLRSGDEQKIFEAFRQSNEDRSGFGLGLAIAQQAIDAHSGTITVRNLPGQGCIFAVTLP